MANVQSPWKLLSYSKGNVTLDGETVTKLKRGIDSPSMAIPIAFITLTGQRQSDCSYYNNLLLKNLYRVEGALLRNDLSTQINQNQPSGIYVWPKPFKKKNYQGHFLLWVLLLHKKQKRNSSDGDEDKLLDYFLHMICSRVLHIVNEIDEQSILSPNFDIFENNGNDSRQIEFEKSFMYLYLTNSKPFQIHTLAPKQDSKMVEQYFHLDFKNPDIAPYLAKYKCVTAAYIPIPQGNARQSRGRSTSTIDLESSWELTQVVNQMLEVNHIWPTFYNAKVVDSNRISAYFRACLKLPYENSQSKEINEESRPLTKLITENIPEIIPLSQARTNVKEIQNSNDRQLYNEPIRREKKRFSLFRRKPKENHQITKGRQSGFPLILQEAQAAFENQMQKNYNDLFLSHLNELPEKFIHDIFTKSIQDVGRALQQKHILKTGELVQLNEYLTNSCTAFKSDYLSSHQLVKQYDSFVNVGTRRTSRFSYNFEGINQKLDEIQNSVFRSNTTNLKRFYEDPLIKLRHHFTEQFQKITGAESSILAYVTDKIVLSYRSKMNQLVSQQCYSLQQLKNVHAYLSNKYAVLIDSLNFENEHLKEKLFIEFRIYRDHNRTQIEKLHKEIESFLVTQKKAYCDGIEEVLKTQPDKIQLESIHDSLLKHIKMRLESELSQMLGSKNGWKKYWVNLESYILKRYWANYKKLTTNISKGTKIPSNNLDSLDSNLSYAESGSTKEILLPIIFHLSLNQISVSIQNMDGSVKRFPRMETTVGITHEGNWKYGNSVSSNTSNFQCIWNVGDLLSGKRIRSETKFEVLKGQKEIVISVEFLLAKLFYSLKRQVEKELNGHLKKGIIIIPFWFTSYQRQQIIQGGKIALMNEVEIVNENSAIALFALQKMLEKVKQKHDIFIISENSDRVDATVYRVDIENKIKVVKMVGHCGTYELSRNSGTHEEMVSSACKKAVKQCRAKGKNGAKLVKRKRVIFISFESNNWNRVLSEAKNKQANSVNGDVFGWETNASTLGALMFYQSRECRLQEWSSASFLYDVNSEEYEFFGRREEAYLPLRGNSLQVSLFLPENAANVRIYQRVFKSRRKTVLGLLRVNNGNDSWKFEATLDHQGILTFLNEDTGAFTWNATNLSDVQVFQYRETMRNSEISENNRVNESIKSREDSRKADLIKAFQYLQKCIDNGGGKFRSEMGRQMAVSQIEAELELLGKQISEKQIDTVVANYSTIKTKYF
ncbi:unnamed protein product [Orchesella dallaii]|uniref:Uncharacterized protein n=1 Tax=Orchesella dallaii TaxID=48710 RepID=A0ABP1RUN9_9HEXA